MKFDEALYNFMRALEAEYGIRDPVVKIGVVPELYSRVMLDLYDKYGKYSSISVNDLCEPHVMGVKIVPRTKSDF